MIEEIQEAVTIQKQYLKRGVFQCIKRLEDRTTKYILSHKKCVENFFSILLYRLKLESTNFCVRKEETYCICRFRVIVDYYHTHLLIMYTVLFVL